MSESQEKHDVRMPTFSHEEMFSHEILVPVRAEEHIEAPTRSGQRSHFGRTTGYARR
jgi:hypothetical protein